MQRYMLEQSLQIVEKTITRKVAGDRELGTKALMEKVQRGLLVERLLRLAALRRQMPLACMTYTVMVGSGVATIAGKN